MVTTIIRSLSMGLLLIGAVLLLSASGCASSSRESKKEVRIGGEKQTVRMIGDASYYGPGFHGKRTANGEVFNKNAMTAAHKTLPFETRVRVTHRETGKSIVVRINDRYPGDKRVIDLSEGSFKKLSPLARGIIPVKMEILE